MMIGIVSFDMFKQEFIEKMAFGFRTKFHQYGFLPDVNTYFCAFINEDEDLVVYQIDKETYRNAMETEYLKK